MYRTMVAVENAITVRISKSEEVNWLYYQRKMGIKVYFWKLGCTKIKSRKKTSLRNSFRKAHLNLPYLGKQNQAFLSSHLCVRPGLSGWRGQMQVYFLLWTHCWLLHSQNKIWKDQMLHMKKKVWIRKKEKVTATKTENKADCLWSFGSLDDGSYKSAADLSWKPEHDTFYSCLCMVSPWL